MVHLRNLSTSTVVPSLHHPPPPHSQLPRLNRRHPNPQPRLSGHPSLHPAPAAINSPNPIPRPPLLSPTPHSLAFSMPSPPPLPLFLLFLSIPLVASQPSDAYIPSCRPTSCGGINVTYPFWIHSFTSSPPSYSTSFCGYPTFDVHCDNGTLTTPLFNNRYIVLGIDSPNRTISLREADIGSDRCPKLSDISIPPPFRFTTDDTNLTFFFNCSSNRTDGLIRCRKEKSYVLRSGEIGGELDGKCGEKVVVPVLKEAVDGVKNLGDGFAEVLKEGFRMEWDPTGMKDCRRCEASGGWCGSRNESGEGLSMLCFCNDGTHVVDCLDGGSGGLNVQQKVIIATASSVAGFLGAMAAVCVWLKRRRGKALSPSRNFLFRSTSGVPSSFVKDPESLSGSYFYTPIFTYEELEVATDGFDSSKELGDGGFGVVYKGVLKDGRVVAVKRLHERNYRRVQQFRNEVEILNRIRHPNLVSLYGCTNRDSRELLLVYEYIPNGTLADHLHGSHASKCLLTWPIRLSIAAETAAALAYLHATEPQIIHRDVKTSNILLDNGFHVKVADFGLSRAFPSPLTTHVSTAPQGTPGYVDPEYHQCYQLTDKSDVYSFGVVLVELISSKPAVDMDRPRSEINLSNMAMAKIPRGLIRELVDATLPFDTDPEVRRTIEAVAELAFRCLQPEKDMRPSMDEVRDTLENLHGGDRRMLSPGGVTDGTCSLLKSAGAPLSPNTVVGNWPSMSTTSTTVSS